MPQNRTRHLLISALCVGGLLFVTTSHCQAINFQTGEVILSAAVNYGGTWKFLIDPVAVDEFQLSVEFDSTRAQFDSITFLNGYAQEGNVIVDDANPDILHNIHGINSAPPPVEVDVVELEFLDLMPNLDPTTALFRVFADPNQVDFVSVVDPPNNPTTFFANLIVPAEGFAVIIPEPSTLTLGSIALLGILCYACRRQRRVAETLVDL